MARSSHKRKLDASPHRKRKQSKNSREDHAYMKAEHDFFESELIAAPQNYAQWYAGLTTPLISLQNKKPVILQSFLRIPLSTTKTRALGAPSSTSEARVHVPFFSAPVPSGATTAPAFASAPTPARRAPLPTFEATTEDLNKAQFMDYIGTLYNKFTEEEGKLFGPVRPIAAAQSYDTLYITNEGKRLLQEIKQAYTEKRSPKTKGKCIENAYKFVCPTMVCDVPITIVQLMRRNVFGFEKMDNDAISAHPLTLIFCRLLAMKTTYLSIALQAISTQPDWNTYFFEHQRWGWLPWSFHPTLQKVVAKNVYAHVPKILAELEKKRPLFHPSYDYGTVFDLYRIGSVYSLVDETATVPWKSGPVFKKENPENPLLGQDVMEQEDKLVAMWEPSSGPGNDAFDAFVSGAFYASVRWLEPTHAEWYAEFKRSSSLTARDVPNPNESESVALPLDRSRAWTLWRPLPSRPCRPGSEEARQEAVVAGREMEEARAAVLIQAYVRRYLAVCHYSDVVGLVQVLENHNANVKQTRILLKRRDKKTREDVMKMCGAREASYRNGTNPSSPQRKVKAEIEDLIKELRAVLAQVEDEHVRRQTENNIETLGNKIETLAALADKTVTHTVEGDKGATKPPAHRPGEAYEGLKDLSPKMHAEFTQARRCEKTGTSAPRRKLLKPKPSKRKI